MQLHHFIFISIWLFSAWATSASKGLVEFFKYRKETGLTISIDELIDEAMKDKAIFREIASEKKDDLGGKCFINAFILNRATFITKLTIPEINVLVKNLKSEWLFESLPRLLDTRKKRRQALIFFSRNPQFDPGYSWEYNMMLLLLFCNCKNPHNQLTKKTLPHIIENIKKSATLFGSMVGGMVIHERDFGIRLCTRLLHYSTLVLGKPDPILVKVVNDILKSSLEIRRMARDIHKFFSSADYMEKCVSKLLKPRFAHVKRGIRFVQYCDPEFAQQVIAQMIDECIRLHRCKAFKCLLQMLPDQTNHTYHFLYNAVLRGIDIDDFVPWPTRTLFLSDLYFLSRFSRHPCEKIREIMLCLAPQLNAHEPANIDVKDWTGLCSLPLDILVLILSQTGPITQLLTVPLVCKAWLEVRDHLLEKDTKLHYKFMMDVGKYGFEEIHCQLPWRAALSTPAQVVHFFARIASFSCEIPNGTEYTRIISRYLKNMQPQSTGQHLDIVNHYIMEYIRLGRRSCGVYSRPWLYRPSSMTFEQYGELIRRVYREHSILPRIPKKYIYEKLVLLYDVIQDEEIIGRILNSQYKTKFDKITANILTQMVAIPPGLAKMLSFNSDQFKNLLERNLSIPLKLGTLATKMYLFSEILFHSSEKSQKRVCELLVHEICYYQYDADRISSITKSLEDISISYLAAYPLMYMLNNPQKFSVEEFEFVEHLMLASRWCTLPMLKLLPFHHRFPVRRHNIPKRAKVSCMIM